MATAERAMTPDRVTEEAGYIKRFDVHQIVQHAGMIASFIVLAVTGLPMKFATWSLSQWWIGALGGYDSVRTIHHLAAYIMVFICLYHAVYLFINIVIRKKPFPRRMVPSRQDIRDFYHEMLYYFGKRPEPPHFDRFNWRQKFDYWAIFWGMPVMGLSGFILMFPVLVTDFLPGWVVPVALVAHSHEAILAVAWIVIVHFFFSHMLPGLFPLNKVIFTGKTTRKIYAHEHPLEYRRIAGDAGRPESGEGEAPAEEAS